MPSYTFATSESAFWLIEPEGNKWRLKFLVRTSLPTNDQCNLFDLPHLAAQAVAEFKTGHQHWDLLPRFSGDKSDLKKWEDSGVHDLKNWKRVDP